MKKKFLLSSILLFLVWTISYSQNNYVDKYNLKWETAADAAYNSIPLGNGDVGINLWEMSNGEIYFYISKNDAYSDCGRLIKIGRVKLSFEPQLETSNLKITHEFSLSKGMSKISLSGATQTHLVEIWVDAHSPIIHIQTQHSQATRVKLSIDKLQANEYTIPSSDLHSAYGVINSPNYAVESKDTLFFQSGMATWYHRNRKSIWEKSLDLQGLSGIRPSLNDPLLNLTFGCAMPNVIALSGNEFATPNAELTQSLRIYVTSTQTNSPSQWLSHLNTVLNQSPVLSDQVAREAHIEWWQKFWNKSYIIVSGDKDADAVSQTYCLQRYMNACGGRGKYPIKFNGSMFTYDYGGYDANYRMWGGAALWQLNTSLLYWSMHNSGDFEFIKAYFDVYFTNLKIAEERSKVFFNHNGAYFPETMYFWGVYPMDIYGWDRTGKALSYIQNNYMRYHYQNGLQALSMMLLYYDYTRKESFLSDTLAPVAKSLLTFYKEHYPRDANGKIFISPAQVLETYWTATNPMPEIAGLQWTIGQLQKITTLPSELRTLCNALQPLLPALPVQSNLLRPAATYSNKNNEEDAELYAVFPYPIYNLLNPNLYVAQNTFLNVLSASKRSSDSVMYYYHGEPYYPKRNYSDYCWRQKAIQAASLGYTSVAKQLLLSRIASHNGRFPVFYYADWIPDQDHIANALTTIQKMVLQTIEDKILPVPSFPKEWNVDFKLYAQDNTIIEGYYSNNRLKCSTFPNKKFDNITMVDKTITVEKYPDFVLGDIDKNSAVQAYDAALALQYSVGLDPLPSQDPKPWEIVRMNAADVDGDLNITANDAAAILQYTVGLITSFENTNLKRKQADVLVSIENNELVFRSQGALNAVNITAQNTYCLQAPTFINSDMFNAQKITATHYAIAMASAMPVAENTVLLRIPFDKENKIILNISSNGVQKNVIFHLDTAVNPLLEDCYLIYPNPSQKELHIRGLKENTQLFVYDTSGKLVLCKTTNACCEKLLIDTWVNGVYTLKIVNETCTITKKFVKQ